MENQALISMEEYNQLLQVKEDYEALIKGLKDKENVILVDMRFGYNPNRPYWHDTNTPKVICGEKLAKEYLQKEFDNVFESLQEAKEKLISRDKTIREQREKLDKKWWQ